MRRIRPVLGYLIGLLLAGLPLATSAQLTPAESALPVAAPGTPAAPPAISTTPAPAEPVYPYTGYVSADLVNIRCGPTLYYYPLLMMSKDTRVVVEGEKDGWLALRPPEGVYGLVRKSDLTIGAAGATATVSASSARVYASSATTTRRWCVMATLRQGDTVQVLGRGAGEFVKIVPPADARVYIVEQYVAATGTQQAILPVDVGPPKTEPLVEAFKQAEKDLRAELAKDVPEREFDAVAAKFKEIAEKAEKAYIKNAAERRVTLIAALAEQQAEYVRVVGLADELDERLATIKTRWAEKQTEAEREKQFLRPDFLATGCVAKMVSLEDVDYPIKFKLVDQNNRPMVVLKSSTYDLNNYLGKIVGVRGTKTYLKEWRIYLVTVDDMEVLEE